MVTGNNSGALLLIIFRLTHGRGNDPFTKTAGFCALFDSAEDANVQFETGAPLKASPAKNLNMGHGMRYRR